ncbi:MAG: hypothetical protein KKD66_26965 [Proteobacteria bacterium]|nr:hypothetical protein [Pseudomonadota bacterium]
MRTILTDTTEITVMVRRFRSVIEDLATERYRTEWKFPNGDKDTIYTFALETSMGRLLVGLPENWSNRVPHLFCLEREGRVLSPDVEINIPANHDRSISGAYLRDNGQIWLCSRGDFNAFRGKIRREVTFKYFEKWLTDAVDDNRCCQVIPVVSLSSSSVCENLAQFVQAVVTLKKLYKDSQGNPDLSDMSWLDRTEFEGKKTSGGSEPVSYDYSHGPLCNALQAILRQWATDRKLEVKRNKHVDVALVDNDRAVAIFEVKTSASLGGQLFSATGQLLYYRSVYGTDQCRLFLVLPSESVNQGFSEKAFFDSLGIRVIAGTGNKFKGLDGKSLRNILDLTMSA